LITEAAVVVREKLLAGRQGAGVDFTICRRVRFLTAEKIVPWDKFDACAECGEHVVYDSRDSEGKPHVCFACAYAHRMSFLSPDSPLDELLPDLQSLSDDEIIRRQDQTRAQNAANENTGAAPSQKPKHKFSETVGIKRAYRV